VEAVKRRCGGGPVTLIAHSAGGWLARVYLLGFGTAGITRLVTLGAPHLPPPPDSKCALAGPPPDSAWHRGGLRRACCARLPQVCRPDARHPDQHQPVVPRVLPPGARLRHRGG
jgi:pimeloyl-ACP methyl ester carboxylesterase